jgi:5-methylcytosine-specific restriction endonuclease McrA
VAGKARVPRQLRERVARTAGYRCGYCRTPESIAGFRMTIEHIVPEARGSQTVEANLWLACHGCNEAKGAHHGPGSRHGKARPAVESAAGQVARALLLE